MKLGLTLLLACWFFLRAGDHSCKMAQVQWLDAAGYSRSGLLPADDLSQMLVPSTTIGCVDVQDKAVIVITTFQPSTKPVDFIVIPAPWITKITFLETANDRPASQQILSEVPGKKPARNKATKPSLFNRLFTVRKGKLP